MTLGVARFPDGPAVHIVTAVLADGTSAQLHDFRGETAAGDTLEVVLEPPVEDVATLRIGTTDSVVSRTALRPATDPLASEVAFRVYGGWSLAPA